MTRAAEKTALLTIKDVAKRFSVCEQTVQKWIRDRKLPCHKVDNVIRIDPDDFKKFLEGTRVAAAKE